jgi:tRNA-Thr(GGU) m(6)t(6)A37 methyltransferase TsaA
MKEITLRAIGVIRAPYGSEAPHQPDEDAAGDFRLVLDNTLVEGLEGLERVGYVYVLFYLDRVQGPAALKVRARWTRGEPIGLFACRSPRRPNPIGLSVVRVKEVRGNEVVISPIDALDGTPILDIKPYFRGIDSKRDAVDGPDGKQPGEQ